MKHSRWPGLLICVILLAMVFSGCGEPGEQPQEALTGEAEIELQTAIELGLVPEELQQDYQKAIQYDEFCALLTNVISLRYGEGPWLDAWQENAALAMNCTEPMTRGGGAEVIFVGALSVGMDDYHSGAYLQADIDGSTQGAALEGAPWRADLLPILDAPYENKVWGRHTRAASRGGALCLAPGLCRQPQDPDGVRSGHAQHGLRRALFPGGGHCLRPALLRVLGGQGLCVHR